MYVVDLLQSLELMDKKLTCFFVEGRQKKMLAFHITNQDLRDNLIKELNYFHPMGLPNPKLMGHTHIGKSLVNSNQFVLKL